MASMNAQDRCDRCSARAETAAVLESGAMLLFCGHHARVYGKKLKEQGAHMSKAEAAPVV